MKLLTVLFLTALSIPLFSHTNVSAQWVRTNGPYGGPVSCFAVSGTNLFAGTDRGVFLTTNNGTTWKAVNAELPANTSVGALAAIGTNVFAAIDGHGVYRSTNN